MVRPQTQLEAPPPARTHRPTCPPLVLAAALLLVAAVAPSAALRCYRCGEYTDGVGSITPCLNYTAQRHLKECPPEANHCVKYVSEASIVRECADKCVEKESWGTNVYCCAEDACNGAPGAVKKPAAAATGAAVAVLVALLGAGAGRLLI
ncbi:U-scoloptoxin(05)-Sm1a isoform X2 [Schistocerca gregaria]|uniref:U-scoloptoxin(05)-Sm1a isoform X2 n=1 Tax=Schistocerca gregaria TaxID=7010 RepID=UPI00211E7676|nr:U-scoloptoxin(05)-Sm1a isoform X2 [Schistocerca gregaria]XP_049862067.1 U-scoloptoxin(05)-Sm1a isoform X2 [Schistocerca gregaria]XP_049862068.1 U-scoloptoxin(05)-Sm1a isoform X2 [Schistocerca gregaria]